MQRLSFLLIYLALSLLEFYSETRLPGNPTLHYLTKPALLAALSLYFYRETRGHRNRRDVLFQIALAFAWLGDVLLMLENGFLAGLGVFLVMQAVYTIVFWERPFRPLWQLPARRARVALALIVVFAVQVFIKISPNLNGLTIPVVVYLLVILTMALTAFNRLDQVPQISFRLVAVGAALFVVSDGFIALTRFSGDAGGLSWLVMPTYAAAQYLIVEGFLRERVSAPISVPT